MKFPERPHARMHALRAFQHFPADAHMRDAPITDDGPRNGKRPLRIVGRFADAPLAFRIAGIAGNDRARSAFEAPDASRIPAQHIVARQHLRLLANGIAGRDALQAAHYAIGDRVGQTLAPQCGRLRDSNAAPATAIVISTDDAGGTATNTAVGVDREDRSTA